jgi:hypothetical protein
MKRLTITMLALIATAHFVFAQTWGGSTTVTGVAARDGNVVIGNTALEGSFGATEKLLQIKGEGTWLSMISTINGGGSFNIGFSAGFTAGFYSRSAPISFWTSPTAGGMGERMRITTTGNVGIGTTNPGGFKLAVEGKIGAREVQVLTTSPFPDYVFEPDYKLLPLSEVKLFIKANKHLPEIPSAEEIKTDGHKLGEMDVLLLKKIEELTLYLIEQQSEIQQLKKELNDLKTK